ncbi:MAG: NAD(+) synthase [Bdellovibrionaceae bacterium]|nr:NAD(+) synthase [Pseudobdellovibrionaceae bacterium]
MKNVRVAAVSLNQTPLAWENNFDNIKQALLECDKKSVQIVCFPELSISGYGCEDAFLSPFVAEKSVELLFALLPFTRGKIVTLGLPLFFKGSVFNVSAVIVDGHLKGLVPKKFLAGDGVHYENRWFRPWENQALESMALKSGGETYQVLIGDYFFEIGGLKVGLEICEEAWVAQRVGASLSRKGVDIILNPSASHFAFGKQDVRKRFVIEGSRAFGVAYVYSNLLGNESGRIIFDGGALIASNGILVMESPRFSYNEFEVYDAVVDVEANRIRRLQTASFKPELGVREESQITMDFNWTFLPPVRAKVERPAWEKVEAIKNEEFYRAVCLGLFDYLRKSRSHGFMISLSGGVDSSVVTILATRCLTEALRFLGKDKFVQKLKYLGPNVFKMDWDIQHVVKSLVTTVYQGSENSSVETKKAAHELSKELGVSFHDWSIAAIQENYKVLIENVIQRKLTWEADDIALQNIQARVRSPGIWMFANIKNALLLATSNRSEAAVGYATMDGDTSGGLSPIAGVDKSFLNKWLRWMSDVGPSGSGSLLSLKCVFIKPPTAELRPTKMQQTDESDLMPYDVLNVIEKEFIRDRQRPRDIVEILKIDFPMYSVMDLAKFTIKFLKLWSRNQWKRERYAPAFHLDDESLDPKTWCRYPVLMSSFESEIFEIQEKYLTN